MKPITCLIAALGLSLAAHAQPELPSPTALTAPVTQKDSLQASCWIEQGTYKVRLRNMGDKSLPYYLADEARPQSTLGKVPFGARYLLSGYLHDQPGGSSLMFAAEALTHPIKMFHLAPREEKIFTFALKDLWWPWIKPDGQPLKDENRMFKVRVSVYTSPDTSGFVTCESHWTSF